MGARDRAKSKRGGNRGGGSKFGATSAEDIERRNARLEEFDQRRAQRRADAADEEDETEGTEQKMGGMSLNDGEGGEKGENAPMTRKQRELAEKERAAAEYRRRHELGLTDEYKKDMEKLAEVRARREKAQARAKAEKDLAEAIEEDRKKKVAELNAFDQDSDSDTDKKKKKKSSKKGNDIPKLDKISIKKMKPAQMKEALKERGLEIQGNAKTLTDRLLKYEASR